jgi:hypothetical protein
LSNQQWYERFNTSVDVGDTIGVTHQQKVLLEYVAQELQNQAFGDLADAEQMLVRDDAEEFYVSYDYLRQNGTQHKTGIYKRGHCSFFPTKVTGPFLPHSKITSKNNKKLDLGLSP